MNGLIMSLGVRMRNIVKSLIKLQELEIVREETCIVHQDNSAKRLTDVDASIEQLRGAIPENYLRRYDGLRRGGVGAVREIGGICRGCHLNVPVGDLNRMRRGDMPWLCPNCGRFLLISTAAGAEEI